MNQNALLTLPAGAMRQLSLVPKRAVLPAVQQAAKTFASQSFLAANKARPNAKIPYFSRAFATQNKPAAKKQSLTPTYQRPLNPFFTSPFSGFDEFFAPSPFFKDPFEDFMPVLRNFNRNQAGMTLRHSSPGYEINETDNEFQIAIDVPGCKPSDMTVQLEEEGRILRLSGGRKVNKGGQVTETKFEKRFTIGENIDTANIAADLSDGVLVVKAPKLPKEEVAPIKIQITEGQRILEEPTAAEAIEEESKAVREETELNKKFVEEDMTAAQLMEEESKAVRGESKPA
jgi:HSP20 family protein